MEVTYISTYVMSDIHGQYTLFEKMLQKINFSQEDQLYVVGDIIDRGPENLKMIEKVFSTSNIHMIMGNHEQMALDYFTYHDSYDREMWFNNGGDQTYKEICESNKWFLNDIKKLFEELPYKVEISVNGKNYVLTHSYPFTEYKEDIVWHRIDLNSNFSEHTKENTSYIVGHTPIPYFTSTRAENKIYKSEDGNVWFIDYGCAYMSSIYENNYGQMGCIRLDDEKLFLINKEEDKFCL